MRTSLCILFAAAGTVFASWPQYHGPNFNRTLSSNAFGPAELSGDLKEVWSVEAHKGFSSFAVADALAATQVARSIGGVEQETLVVFDAATGRERWAKPLGFLKYGHDGGNSGAPGNRGGDGPRSTPAIDGDRVYVINSDLVLFCFNLSDGKMQWSRDILREHDGKNITWKNAASPVIEDDLIFMAGGGGDQALLAIDKHTGEVKWKRESDRMTHATPVIATIHGLKQVIFFTQEGLVSCDLPTGLVLWRQDFPFNVSTAASPVVAGDIVYCSAGYGVGGGAYRISRNGTEFEVTELWRRRGDEPVANHWSTPVYHDGHLYGMFSFKKYGDGPIKCVELATGEVKWEQEGFGAGNVTLAGDRLVALGDSGQLAVIEATPEGYRELFQEDVLDGKCWSSPTLANGRIYVRSTTEGKCLEFQ